LTFYVLRGGSWVFGSPDDFCAASRNWDAPDYGDCDFGFRIVLHLQKASRL